MLPQHCAFLYLKRVAVVCLHVVHLHSQNLRSTLYQVTSTVLPSTWNALLRCVSMQPIFTARIVVSGKLTQVVSAVWGAIDRLTGQRKHCKGNRPKKESRRSIGTAKAYSPGKHC
jgi:hypothetical protein